jgi:hypothetical protein
MHKAKNVGLDFITLQFHTSHVLQAFDVDWFTPSNCLGAYKDVWTLVNKTKKVGKEDLAQWVSLIFKKVFVTTPILRVCEDEDSHPEMGTWEST